MELLRIRESCALSKKVQKEHVREIHRSLPLKVMGPGGVEHAWKSLTMMKEGLDSLVSVPVALDVGWQQSWKEQHKQVQTWCEALTANEEVLRSFERCVVELREAELRCDQHWENQPQELTSMVSPEDSIEGLEQIRLDCLMEMEGDKDEENPEKNPYFPFQARNTARWGNLGLHSQGPSIVAYASQHKAQEILLFQVEWLSKIPAMLMECTNEEVQELDVPTVPYQKDEVIDFLEQYRILKDRKKGWGRIFQAKYVVEDELLWKYHLAKRIEQGQPFVEMVYVEEGRYRLEVLGGRPHTIRHPFWISIVPVTDALFSFFSSHMKKTETPKTGLSWFQALHFCNMLSQRDGYEPCYTLGIGPDQVVWNQDADGYRLPTEYEWEVAAQSGFAHKSARWDCYIWSLENANQIMEVAKKTPNHRCLYDMLGNVWEWCFDAFALDMESESIDPALRVIRGGSWRCSKSEFTLGMRESRALEKGYSDVGFRLVRNG